MTFSITLFGPSHYWWEEFKHTRSWRKHKRFWFDRPDKYSSGGVGFCIPGLHVVFTWGKE